MAVLSSCTQLWNCCTLIFLLSFINIAFALVTFEMRFRDQVEKLKSDEYYFQGLRQFTSESIGVMTYLPERNSLLLGARNCFFAIDLTLPFAEDGAISRVNWTVTDETFNLCSLKGEEEWECQNFIQVIEYDSVHERLVVCGTRAQDPRCRVYGVNNYPLLENPDEMDGKRKCPFDPTQKSTALFADGALYTATVGDSAGRDSVIYRSSLGQSGIVELESKEIDATWFNSPIFIESFEVEDWVLVFFREVAGEHTSSGDAIYSRVAKVCKSDLGGLYILEEKWTTYQKARLNCSFPGAYPFYFNYLQDVWMVGEGENRMFYGVFSTGEHEIPGSAVCVFHMRDLRHIFEEGEFKEQKNGLSYAVHKDMEPVPRPGNCSLDSKDSTDDSLRFIVEHPLMDQAVPSHGDPYPIFDLTRADYRLSQIAIYTQRAKEPDPYHVLFIGTENGIVLKLALVPDGDKVRSNLLEKIYITPRDCQERIKEMKIVQSMVGGVPKDMLMVVTNSSVVELPLHRCENYTQSCSCIQDPFCVWNNISQECYEFSNNAFDYQDVRNIQDCEEKEIPEPTPTTAAECLCEPPASSSFKPVTGDDRRKEDSTKQPTTGNNREGNEIPDNNSKGIDDNDSNLIGPGSEASTGLKSSTEQLMLVFLVIGWAAFLFCLPVILFLLMSNRRKDEKQMKDGSEENPLRQNGLSTFHHLFPPASHQESSTDPPLNSVRRSPSLTQSKAATMERGIPPGENHTQSLSRKKPTPPVPPKRTNSVLSHTGPRCPPPNGYARSPRRDSNQTTPVKKRQSTSSSSSDSFDREPPPYHPLSGSEDERRRRPSGSSNTDLHTEFDHAWLQRQNRPHEDTV